MNFIKKVFSGKVDNETHLQFQKFSRGEFRDRALIKAKRQGNGFSISTGSEFANELVKTVAEKLGSNKTKVTGAIVSTLDLKDLDFKDKKQFQGVKRYILDNEMTGTEILNLLQEFPRAFFALTFVAGDTKLKIKPKAPKSGKPSSKSDEGPKADFCNIKTPDPKIAEDFIFEQPGFKEAEINHTCFIKDIIIPKELKTEKDFAKIREAAIRKGKILRRAKIDGQTMKEEKEFEA